MYRIFIVEDDAAIAQAVCEQAESWALEARCVSDFRRVAEEAAAYDPHLILLDISLCRFSTATTGAARSAAPAACPSSSCPRRRTI